MQAACERLEGCGYFRQHQDTSNARYKIWVKIFCESRDKAKECARRRYMQETGELAPDNMTPTGRMI